MPQCTRSVSIRLSCKFSHSNIRQSFNKRLQVFQQVTPSSRSLQCQVSVMLCRVEATMMKRINAQYLEYLEKILKDPCGSKLFQKVLVMLTVYPMFIQTIRLSVFIIGLVSLIPCLMKKYPVAHFEKLYHHFLSQIFLHHACLDTRRPEKKHQTSKNGKLIFSIPLTRSLASTT